MRNHLSHCLYSQYQIPVLKAVRSARHFHTHRAFPNLLKYSCKALNVVQAQRHARKIERVTLNRTSSSKQMSSTSYHALALLQSSRATQLAVRALRELYPEELADSSWDNTGLLLEAPIPTRDAEKKSTSGGKVLLTIDLTTAVAKEAVEKGVDLVVAYRESRHCSHYLFQKLLSQHSVTIIIQKKRMALQEIRTWFPKS